MLFVTAPRFSGLGGFPELALAVKSVTVRPQRLLY